MNDFLQTTLLAGPGSPILWTFFPEIRCGGNTASRSTVSGSKARREDPTRPVARILFSVKQIPVIQGAACSICEFQIASPPSAHPPGGPSGHVGESCTLTSTFAGDTSARRILKQAA